jgi:hypothetical protein
MSNVKTQNRRNNNTYSKKSSIAQRFLALKSALSGDIKDFLDRSLPEHPFRQTILSVGQLAGIDDMPEMAAVNLAAAEPWFVENQGGTPFLHVGAWRITDELVMDFPRKVSLTSPAVPTLRYVETPATSIDIPAGEYRIALASNVFVACDEGIREVVVLRKEEDGTETPAILMAEETAFEPLVGDKRSLADIFAAKSCFEEDFSAKYPSLRKFWLLGGNATKSHFAFQEEEVGMLNRVKDALEHVFERKSKDFIAQTKRRIQDSILFIQLKAADAKLHEDALFEQDDSAMEAAMNEAEMPVPILFEGVVDSIEVRETDFVMVVGGLEVVFPGTPSAEVGQILSFMDVVALAPPSSLSPAQLRAACALRDSLEVRNEDGSLSYLTPAEYVACAAARPANSWLLVEQAALTTLPGVDKPIIVLPTPDRGTWSGGNYSMVSNNRQGD